ncbi:MAG: hypothetical protein U0M06_11700 [Clostridia bacterium]|nr:hypothetical protein [Clostridia bacterium]
MKKIFLRAFFAVILAVLTITFAGCGGGSGHGLEEESDFSLSSLDVIPPNTEKENITNTPVMSGEFKIIRENSAESSFVSYEESKDVLSTEIYERNKLMSEKYGVDITEVVTSDITSHVLASVLSEESDHDMIALSASSASSLITSGALCDLESISGFRSDGAGYSQSVINSLSLGGRCYLAAGDATPSLIRSASVLIVDTELLLMAGVGTDIIDIAARGGFTLSELLKAASTYSGVNGALGENGISLPSYSINADPSDSLALFMSAGGSFFSRDDVTDVMTAASFSEKNSDIYSMIMSIYGINETNTEEDTDNVFSPVFTTASIGEIEELKSKGRPVALLPMPKMSVGDEYISYVDVEKVTFTALPANSNKESSLAVMNLIYSLSADMSAVVRANFSESDSEKKIYDIVYNGMRCDPLVLFRFGDIQNLMSSCIEERLSLKAFDLRASERSLAAVAALAIVESKLGR